MADILELRDDTGALRAFEVPESCTNLWALCQELTKVPGLAFPDLSKRPSFLSAPPVSEFLFKAERYQIHHMNNGFWVGPAEDGAVLLPTESLLKHVRHRIIGRRWHQVLATLLPS
jgi:hypothetical protein